MARDFIDGWEAVLDHEIAQLDATAFPGVALEVEGETRFVEYSMREGALRPYARAGTQNYEYATWEANCYATTRADAKKLAEDLSRALNQRRMSAGITAEAFSEPLNRTSWVVEATARRRAPNIGG